VSEPRDPFPAYYDALESRHRAELTFAEVRRALQALSSLYVERRDGIALGKALEGRGKRAAFALYYGPLHFLLVREIVRALRAATPPPRKLLDLGCGTGAAGLAWAAEGRGATTVEGVERSGWAVQEARWSAAQLSSAGPRGVSARFVTGDLGSTSFEAAPGAILLAFTVNELTPAAQSELLPRLLAAARKGSRVLVVEPLARRALLFWNDWSDEFQAAGGRADEWRFPAALPPTLKLLDKAAGLDHRTLTGRSLYLPGRP
jgi:SAM-dependent methyltransferase